MEIPQRFEVRYRVRFDEADASGSLRPSGLLRYAQDAAWQHSEVAGFDRHWYSERGTFWLVRNVVLRISTAVGYGDHVTATTEVTGWRRVWARRHTVFATDDGSPVAEIDTDWVLLTTNGRPTRIPEELSRFFAPGMADRLDKLELPQAPLDAVVADVTVRLADVDPMGHLNNAAYLDIMEASLPDVADVTTRHSDYRLEYLRPALPGSRLRVASWRGDDGRLACRIADGNGVELFRALTH